MREIRWRMTGLLLEVLAYLLHWIARKRGVRSGQANPRASHLNMLGYALRNYRILAPNIRRWLAGRTELFPRLVAVQTVNRCNAACPMCPYPYTTGQEPYQIMDDALWQRIVLECAPEPELQALVPMLQNEPLLDRKLEGRIAFFRQHALPHQQVEIVTNGSRLDGARLQRLQESGLDLLTISVSAATRETYGRTMPGLRWERLLRLVEELRAIDTSRVALFVRFVRQRGNKREERAFREQWSRAGFNVMAFDLNNRAGTVKEYDSLLAPTPWRERLRWRLLRPLTRAIFPVCPYAFSMAHILVNGDVSLCANDWHNREILGNVREQSLREIYNSPRAREIRRLMEQNRYGEIAPCRDCSLWQEVIWL